LSCLSSNPQAPQAKNRLNDANGAISNVEVAPAGSLPALLPYHLALIRQYQQDASPESDQASITGGLP
jgi:hypothetical protein